MDTNMKITNYRFGYIEIDGNPYDSDLIILTDHVVERWWRREGHSLAPDDLLDVIELKPHILVVGTGKSGQMNISQSTQQFLESKGIIVRAAPTVEAVELFNKLQESNFVIGAFHLTC
jgi:hypothetical protein